MGTETETGTGMETGAGEGSRRGRLGKTRLGRGVLTRQEELPR